MSRTTSGSGPISPWAAGQENTTYNILFDESSTESTSHVFTVDNNFVRIAAFNMAPGDVATIEQITGLAAGDKVADYAPIHGPVKLYYNSATDQRTSYILERPGRYRVKLSAGVGLVHIYAIQFFIENEASQDVADALYAIINNLTAPNPCAFGAVVPVDPTANNNVLSKNDLECVVDQQLVSNGAGNLIQLRTDGVYYGIQPPPNFANQYVSSVSGNDSNAGTIGSPLRTIRKAISNLPDGTMGDIYLKAGETFYTYPDNPTDYFNTLTLNQTTTAIVAMDIGNRIITIRPYNDTPIDDINAYNIANNTGYDAYIAAETNWPIVVANISQTTDSSAILSIPFSIGVNGSLGFLACIVREGQTGTIAPAVGYGFIRGSGNVGFHGGKVILGSASILANANSNGSQIVTITNLQAQLASVPSNPSTFCDVGTYYTIVTIPAFAAGGLIVPALTYTNIGDNVETFLATAAYWPGIVVYSTAFRSFRHVLTSIPIA